MICPYFPTPFLFFISEEVPLLLYYSHVPIFIISILIGFFVLIKDRFSLLSKALAIPLFLFSLWLLFDLITWTNNSSDTIMFVWSFFGLLLVLISFFFFRFLYIFIKKEELPFYLYLIYFILILPVILLTFTSFNLTGFDLVLCASLEKDIFTNYYFGVGFLILIYTCIFLIESYRKSDPILKREILLMGIGTLSFLFAFLLTGFSGSLLKYLGLVENYQIEQYVFYPMIIFIIGLGYLTTKYKIFNLKLLATQAFVWGLVALIGSQFFFIKISVNFILNGIGFFGSIILGQYLIKSVKKEIEAKEELVKLNIELKDLLKQRESLVHLVTHKVKGSFTRSKYIFAGLLDGTFGEISEVVKKYAQMGLESDNGGIQTVNLVLNASNLSTGGVKYEMKPVDFKEIVQKVLVDKKIQAEAKGLQMESNIHDEKGDVYNVSGDVFWLTEAVNNLIDNSIKYTKEGKISIDLHDGNGKVNLSVKDTGIGITEEDKKHLFTEGGRGKESVKVNVDSTGYGLYSVKLIIQEHKGKVWAESEGEGKGSAFYIELPADSTPVVFEEIKA
jgi:signal transduction histidine kinase